MTRDARDELMSKLNLSIADIRGCLEEVRQAILDLEKSYAEIRKCSKASMGQVELLPGVTLDQVQMHTNRLSARLHNSGLRDPSSAIVPVHAYDENGHLELPDERYYPKSVREFFSLRTSTCPRHQEMLSYLIGFYDIPLPVFARSPPEEDGELTEEGRSLAVDKLASTICLLEAGCTLFEQLNEEQRAQLVAGIGGQIARLPSPPAE